MRQCVLNKGKSKLDYGRVQRTDYPSFKRHMHHDVRCSTIYNSQVTEATWLSINR